MGEKFEFVEVDQDSPLPLHSDKGFLPEKSQEIYLRTYSIFMEWKNKHEKDSLSEKVLREYFKELAEKSRSGTLWNRYSMLRSTLKIHHNVDIGTYKKLKKFIYERQSSEGASSTCTKSLTNEELKTFIIEAPNKEYLATKVNNKSLFCKSYIITKFGTVIHLKAISRHQIVFVHLKWHFFVQ